MSAFERNGVSLHYALTGPEDGLLLVFANSLGTVFGSGMRVICHALNSLTRWRSN